MCKEWGYFLQWDPCILLCIQVERGSLEVKPINCTQSPSSFPELRRFQSVVIELPILCSCLIVYIDSRTIIVSEHACTRVDSGSLKVEPINCTQSSSSFLELEHYQSVVIKRPILEKKNPVPVWLWTCAGRVTAGTVPRSPPKFTLRARMLVLTKKVFFFFFPMCWKHGETNLGVKL